MARSGSGTAALFAPRTCDEPDTGIMRVTRRRARRPLRGRARRRDRHGDPCHRRPCCRRSCSTRSSGRATEAAACPATASSTPAASARRMRPASPQLGVVASIQPIHAAADRDLVEACWGGRQDDAYAWRSLAAAGAHLAAGSDAPVESVNPWLGIFAAVHRRLPRRCASDWRPAQALTVGEALSAYTLGPARGHRRSRRGAPSRRRARRSRHPDRPSLDTLAAADDAAGRRPLGPHLASTGARCLLAELVAQPVAPCG